MKIHRCALSVAVLITVSLSTADLSFAQNKTTSTRVDQQALSLTVYNSNVALVRDVRQVRLPTGNVEFDFADVASAIEPATVRIVSLTDPKQLTVLEQDYRYDLLTPARLLHYYVGKQITLVRQVTENNVTKELPMKATLLSDNPGGQVWQSGNEIITGMFPYQYIFPALPPGLYGKPTLVWLLNNRDAGEQKLEADYMTKSVNWSADYVLTLPSEGTTADLSSWVTLSNGSGASFRDAQLQLVAGQVHQARQPVGYGGGVMALQAKAMAPEMQQEGLSEYHLYTIERPVTLPDQSSKQIAFLRASGIKLQKTYEINGQQYYFYSPIPGGQPGKEPVQAHLKFKNSEDNSLGVPLPAGTVRVYQADSRGRLQFVGEDQITHTAKDENLNLYIGNAFDIAAERKQTDFQTLGKEIYESAYQITIRNHKKDAITVEVNEPLTGEWTVLESNYKYEKTSAFSIRFQVPVAADGQSVLKYRVRVHR